LGHGPRRKSSGMVAIVTILPFFTWEYTLLCWGKISHWG
jgi:hypothetical protein